MTIRINNPSNQWTPNSDYLVIVKEKDTEKESRCVEPTDRRGHFDRSGLEKLGYAIVDVIEKVNKGAKQ